MSLLNANPEIFAKVLNRMESVRLTNIADSSKNQVEAFFNLLSLGSSIKSLTLDNWNCFDASEIDTEVVSKAFNQLDELTIFSTKVDDEKLRFVFHRINGENKVSFSSFDGLIKIGMDRDILESVVRALEIAEQPSAQLTHAQIDCIFRICEFWTSGTMRV